MTDWINRVEHASLIEQMRSTQRRWLVTGVAGFIGSNIAECLVLLGQNVIGIDNFSTGHQRNLDAVAKCASESHGTLTFIEGDIRNSEAVNDAMRGIDIVLHQAALGSVPRSVADPRTSHEVNVDGFFNVLNQARIHGVRSFVYAASSSTYGDEPNLPKVEERIGKPLSPYAGTKLVNEIYAEIYSRTYEFGSFGLRYFNVFGPRQDPAGAYAAVIPKWIDRMICDGDIRINGDGETSRDFCYIDNVVQANLRAGLTDNECKADVLNVAVGERTSLKTLFDMIRNELSCLQINYEHEAIFEDFRIGDVRHSIASIDKAVQMIGYNPSHTLEEGLKPAIRHYFNELTCSPEM